jgi:hypothetical protein
MVVPSVALMAPQLVGKMVHLMVASLVGWRVGNLGLQLAARTVEQMVHLIVDLKVEKLEYAMVDCLD